MIHKKSFFNHEFPCYPQKIIKSFKLLNNREELWNDVGNTALCKLLTLIWVGFLGVLFELEEGR